MSAGKNRGPLAIFSNAAHTDALFFSRYSAIHETAKCTELKLCRALTDDQCQVLLVVNRYFQLPKLVANF